LCAAMLRQLDAASPREVAMVCWALATLGFTPRACGLVPALFDAVPYIASQQQHHHQQQQQLQPTGLANLTWGLGRLSRQAGVVQPPAPAIAALEEASVCLAPQLAALPQECVMLLRGMSDLGYNRPELWRRLAVEVRALNCSSSSACTCIQLLIIYRRCKVQASLCRLVSAAPEYDA
jgi:hypothetical protein